MARNKEEKAPVVEPEPAADVPAEPAADAEPKEPEAPVELPVVALADDHVLDAIEARLLAVEKAVGIDSRAPSLKKVRHSAGTPARADRVAPDALVAETTALSS
jgi:hypothetical protein